MELILALLVGGGCVAFGSWALKRRRRASRPPETETRVSRTLAELIPEDVVTHDAADWMVAGVASFSEGPEHWIEARLEDGAREAWLVVSASDPDAVLFGERVDDLIVGETPSESVDHRGDVFRLERHGQASVVSVEGDVASTYTAGQVRYWNYRRPGDRRIWLRHVGETWLRMAGSRVARHLLGFLPGS